MAQIAGDRNMLVDPVSHAQVQQKRAGGKSFYHGRMYYFETDVNRRTFDEDPELWIPTPHASQNSANIDPVDE